MLVDKVNVLVISCLWCEIVEEVVKDYLDVEFDYIYIDNVIM